MLDNTYFSYIQIETFNNTVILTSIYLEMEKKNKPTVM